MSINNPEPVASVLRSAAAAKPLWLEVSGTSMGGAIVSGDTVLVIPSPRPRRGEVWAFCNAEASIVVHRSRGPRRGGWLFEGDAVGRADPVISSSWLIGRVVSIRHGEVARHVGGRDRALGMMGIAARRARRALRRGVRRITQRSDRAGRNT